MQASPTRWRISASSGQAFLLSRCLRGRPPTQSAKAANGRSGHSRKPKRAVAFYSVLAISVVIGIGLNFTALDPIKALYRSAVVNGALAPPVMALMMLLVRKKKVMGELQVEGWLYWLGWLATAAMALSIAGLAVSMIYGGG
jgi:Mn2+/Fe2+ NRAMP family transporter